MWAFCLGTQCCRAGSNWASGIGSEVKFCALLETIRTCFERFLVHMRTVRSCCCLRMEICVMHCKVFRKNWLQCYTLTTSSQLTTLLQMYVVNSKYQPSSFPMMITLLMHTSYSGLISLLSCYVISTSRNFSGSWWLKVYKNLVWYCQSFCNGNHFK